MPVSKKPVACELSRVLTPSINYSLLLKPCYPKQVVVAWNEIKAVRRVVKQLPVKMLRQC
jgi:hypothetical protein